MFARQFAAYMSVTLPAVERPAEAVPPRPLVRVLVVVALLFLFLLGVNGLGDGFKSLGQDFLDSFFKATSNPFTGLMVGILATTLVQSSSVTTSLIVGLVAAPLNPLPIANAVPMIMGANIGTTVTNSIVSLAHMGRPDEFRRAFSVATCHDFFNYMAVAVLLPLELATGFLQRSATVLSSYVTGFGGAAYESPIKGVLKAGLRPIKGVIGFLFENQRLEAVLLIAVSGILIFTALILLVKVMRSTLQTRVELFVSKALDVSPLLAMLVGVIVTVMVQSSSITTSLLVPLAGAGILTLYQAFPITIGANIGTTVTAFLAALAATGPHAQAAITIAMVHLLFNVTATLMIYPVPAIREIPLRAARRLAEAAVRSRRWALVYVLGLFYGLPALFAILDQLLS
jgi:sodium-dependent phosphate cotransporter